MNGPVAESRNEYQANDDVSLLALGSTLLRWRRTILVFAVGGVSFGVAATVLTQRLYVSSATFLPQASEASVSSIAAAASQFGFRMPTNSGAWGPSLYVELLRSPALLDSIAGESFDVAELGGRHVAVADLFEIKAPTPAMRTHLTVQHLGAAISASEDKALGAVRLSVATRWPSVSLALISRLLLGVNDFNLRMRKSQARAERQFVEGQASEAEAALRVTEGRLQAFLEQNRALVGAPKLVIERDRLQRDMASRQQLYTQLLQNVAESRIREVRDTPVITVVEQPGLPVVGESRKSVRKILLGGIVGGMFGLLTAFVAQALSRARQRQGGDAQEFFRLISDATPGFLKGGTS